jgi:hypothetical protein
MSLLDRILARRLARDGARVLASDAFESPSAYPGWLLPVRLLVTLRYFRLKRDVLSRYAFERRIPKDDGVLARDLRELGNARAEWAGGGAPPLPRWSFVLRAWFFYPVMALACAAAIWSVREWRAREALNESMSILVPHYANAVFERTAMRVDGASDSELAEADAAISALRVRIAEAVPNGARSATERALLVMADDRIDDESVRREVLSWQRALRESEVPFFVEAHVHRAPCLTLLEGSFGLRELAVSLTDTEECRVTLLLPYHVRERERFTSNDGEHHVAYLYRADTMPIRETALGLTYADSRESLVFLDRIRGYVTENVMPALNDDGIDAMFPIWVTLTPDGERLLTSAVRTSLDNVYGGALEGIALRARNVHTSEDDRARARLAQTLQTMGESPEGRSWEELGLEAISSSRSAFGDTEPVRALDPLPVPELEEIEARFVHAIASHELEHQLPSGPVRPQWDAAMEEYPAPALDPIARETSAYLRGLIAGEDIRHLLLAQLASFVTNPMARAGTERTASRVILRAMHQCQEGQPATVHTEPDYTLVMQALASLVDDADDAELGSYARCAYEGLFGHEPPELR